MKRLIYITAVLLIAVATGCSKADQLLYSDEARVQLNDTTTISHTFIYEPSTKTKDTVYIQVNTIGNIANYDREVSLVQVLETDKLNPAAVPGVHYVPLDDPAIKKAMVVKANAVSVKVPIVLLRDPSLRTNSYRLRLQLAGNGTFGLGEIASRALTIQFSDRLERFYSWRFDTGSAPAFYAFGKYSVNKHQFMIDVLKTQIDEEWYQAIFQAQAIQHYKSLLNEKLIAFNNDPKNIQSGLAPLHETSDPNSPLVFFPN